MFPKVFVRYVLEGSAAIFFVSEVGESSKWDDLKVGVVDYPEAMQDARSCYHTRGISYGWMRRVF
jgi:hypothetical protein